MNDFIMDDFYNLMEKYDLMVYWTQDAKFIRWEQTQK